MAANPSTPELTDAWIAEQEKIAEAATARPWEIDPGMEGGVGAPFRAGAAIATFEDGRRGIVGRFHHDSGPGIAPDSYALPVYIGISVEQAYRNRNAVVEAMNHYPALLSEVKRLRAELKEARERADQLGAALAVAHDRGRCPACLIGNCFTANVIARTLTSTKESPPNAD